MPITMDDLLADVESPQESGVDPSDLFDRDRGEYMPFEGYDGAPHSSNSYSLQTTAVSSSTHTKRIDVVGTSPLRQAHDDSAMNSLLPPFLRGGMAANSPNGGGSSVSMNAGTEDIDFAFHETDMEMMTGADGDVEASQETFSAPLLETKREEEPVRRDAHISLKDSATSSEGGSCMSSDEGAGRVSGSLSHGLGESLKEDTAEDVEGDDAAVDSVAEEASEFNIRIDEATGNVSILDTLRALDGNAFEGGKGSNVLFQIKEKYSDLGRRTTQMQLNGRKSPTFTAQPLVLCEIAYLAMEGRPNNRRDALVKVMEFLSVDAAWLAKWEKKYSEDSDSSSGSGKSSSKKQTNTQEEAALDVDAQGEDSVEEQDEGEDSDSSEDDEPIRTNEAGDIGHVTDMLRWLDPEQCPISDRAGPWRKLNNAYPHLKAKTVLTCFNGAAGASFPGLVEIAWFWMQLQRYTPKARREEVAKLCKLLGVATSVLDKLEEANAQPASTTSDGKRKAAVLESDQEGGSSTSSRKSSRDSIDKSSASAKKSGRPSKASISVSSPSDKKKVYVPADFELRIDEKTSLGSVNDVINNVLSRQGGGGKKKPSTVREREELAEAYPALAENFEYTVCNGKGGRTDLADAETLIKIVFLLDGEASKEHREHVAKQVCDAFGQPRSLAKDVQKSLASDRREAAANKEAAEKRAAKEKRPRSFESTGPTDRVMKMRASTTAVSAKASHDSAPTSTVTTTHAPAVGGRASLRSASTTTDIEVARSTRGKSKDKDGPPIGNESSSLPNANPRSNPKSVSDAAVDSQGASINESRSNSSASNVSAKAGGGGSSMNIVQDSESGAASLNVSAGMQARLKEAEARAAIRGILLAELERINKSEASAEAKKVLEQKVLAEYE